MPVTDGPGMLPDVAARLAAAGLRVSDLALRRPSLDDVFLALTGQTTAPTPHHGTDRRSRRRRPDDHRRDAGPAGPDDREPGLAGWPTLATVTGRNLRRLVRVPTLIAFATVQPVMFVVLFTYAWGGAIHPPGVDRYIDYALPGIWVLAIAFGASQTGVALADDLATGMIDRFRALPMARSAVLAGRVTADAVRNLFVLALMTGVAHAIGFRFHAGAGRRAWPRSGSPWRRRRLLVDLRPARTAGPRRRVGRHRRPARRHPADLHQLHLRPDGHLPRLARRRSPRSIRSPSPSTRCAHCAWAGPPPTAVWQALAWIGGLLVVTVPAAVMRYRRTTTA